MNLSDNVGTAGLTYRLKSSLLKKLEILTIQDLLFYLPFRYEDYSNNTFLNRLKIDELASIQGTLVDIKNEYTKRRFIVQKAHLTDGNTTIECMWFNQRYLTRVIKKDDKLGLVGKLEFSGKERVFQVKDYELLEKTHGIHTQGLVPVYSETRGLSSKWIRNRIYDLLTNHKDLIEDFLPSEIIKKYDFEDLYQSILSVHFPKSLEEAQIARKRLAFDELFLMQLSSLKRRQEWEVKRKGVKFEISKNNEEIEKFINSLPFKLTEGQKSAVDDIKNDLIKDIPMNRLVEGDVGSGKTVVAAVSMIMAYLNGYQSVLMAPTQILAEQHYETLMTFLEPFGLKVELITGSTKPKKTLEPKTLQLKPNVIVGTHAVIQKSVNFDKLGLVVIDEQQRFGVEQRAILREKGTNPHFLTMTATPIPRTVLLAAYKDLDVSVLPELPKGRKSIKTWLVPNKKRESGYKWIEKQIVDSKFADQAFIVCPFIEVSESMDTVKAAKVEFERLAKEDFKNLKLGLLHGKLKAKEKTEILDKFAKKEINILVSTPVVEVGIDIPDATIMVIEAADRFGLSQLHQLRGRVGRGQKQSYCLLFSESYSKTTYRRLKYMESTHSGFELAEFDLKMRGPGDMYGTAQSGLVGFKIADFSDFDMIEKAKNEANEYIKELEKHPKLLEKTENITQKIIHPD